MKSLVASLLICGFLFISATELFSQNTLNPNIEISDIIVENLDGAYSVVSVLDNGDTQQFNIKFNNGKIISIVIDGEELEKSQWKDNTKLIVEYVNYLVPDKQKTYKYQDIYDLETDLKQDIEKLEKHIKELEISHRLDKFYEEEMKEWILELESELEDSEVLKEVEDVLENVMNELDRFLNERKEYLKKK